MNDPPARPPGGQPSRHSRDQTRKERLAAALRANLKRRKVRQYAQAGKASTPAAAGPGQPAGAGTAAGSDPGPYPGRGKSD
ncbi:MAG: hypothetical protein U1E97_13320 [Alphaproteobacteria bacterium]